MEPEDHLAIDLRPNSLYSHYMTFEYIIQLPLPRDQVWRAMDNPWNLWKWQKTMRSFELLSGLPGQVGSQAKLIYFERGREVALIQTITARQPFELLSGQYSQPWIINSVTNQFLDDPNSSKATIWKVQVEFQFKGFFKWLAPIFLKRAIYQRLAHDVEEFKRQLTAGALQY